MSVIVRNSAGSILLLTKGADTVILPALAETSKASPALLAGLVHIEMFAEAGLRTLMCAVRELERETYEAWKAEHFDPAARALEHRDDKLAAAAAIIETELEYVCVTAIEDKLQEGVSDTISLLRKAGINVWVLTGDKQGTAINIAMSCELLTPAMQLHVANEDTAEATVARLVALEKLVPVESEQEQAFVIDGHTLFHALEDKVGAATFEEVSTRCRAVIVCRATPLQKASVVKMVRVRKPPGGGPRALTLAIGDGSNDVSMIQAAHVGVGISGREGLQAARAADYAIAQFRYLAVLLLKHGAWSYQRTTMVINYSFYKNIALYLIQLWFAFFNGLSGQTLFERWTISLFNVLFTSLPILVHGLYNAEFSASTQLLFPELYWAGRNRELFNTKVFWSWCANAVFHSLVLYFFVTGGLGASASWRVHGGGVGGEPQVGAGDALDEQSAVWRVCRLDCDVVPVFGGLPTRADQRRGHRRRLLCSRLGTDMVCGGWSVHCGAPPRHLVGVRGADVFPDFAAHCARARCVWTAAAACSRDGGDAWPGRRTHERCRRGRHRGGVVVSSADVRAREPDAVDSVGDGTRVAADALGATLVSRLGQAAGAPGDGWRAGLGALVAIAAGGHRGGGRAQRDRRRVGLGRG